MGYLNEDGLATLVGKVKGQVVQLTSAEYRNLPASKNSDNKTYFVTDEDYAYAIDDEPTLNSDNLVKSGGVYTYTSKIGSGTLSTTAQTIIPAINELDAAIDTINAYSTGDLTKESSNISAVEYARFMRIGNVAWVTANFTIGTAITDSTPILFSGAPHARRYLRSTGMMVQGQSGRYVRYEINTEGQIRGSYTNGGIATGMYEITLCYPCQD